MTATVTALAASLALSLWFNQRQWLRVGRLSARVRQQNEASALAHAEHKADVAAVWDELRIADREVRRLAEEIAEQAEVLQGRAS